MRLTGPGSDALGPVLFAPGGMPMADAFDIELNTSEVVFALNRLKSQQIPFAQSLALNWTLKDDRARVVKELPRKFKIRRPWVVRGVQVKTSSKRTLWGSIGQRDSFMTLQETGGTKRPARVSIALPVGQLARLAQKQVLSKAKRPAGQLRKKGVYLGRTRKNVPAIIKRGTSRKRQEVLYIFKSSARIDRRFGFVLSVTKETRKVHAKNFGKALAKAIATAR